MSLLIICMKGIYLSFAHRAKCDTTLIRWKLPLLVGMIDKADLE